MDELSRLYAGLVHRGNIMGLEQSRLRRELCRATAKLIVEGSADSRKAEERLWEECWWAVASHLARKVAAVGTAASPAKKRVKKEQLEAEAQIVVVDVDAQQRKLPQQRPAVVIDVDAQENEPAKTPVQTLRDFCFLGVGFYAKLHSKVRAALQGRELLLACLKVREGDLHRYLAIKCGPTVDLEQLALARSCYDAALEHAPGYGSAFNQLGVCCSYVEDHLGALYNYVRAVAASERCLSAQSNIDGFVESEAAHLPFLSLISEMHLRPLSEVFHVQSEDVVPDVRCIIVLCYYIESRGTFRVPFGRVALHYLSRLSQVASSKDVAHVQAVHLLLDFVLTNVERLREVMLSSTGAEFRWVAVFLNSLRMEASSSDDSQVGVMLPEHRLIRGFQPLAAMLADAPVTSRDDTNTSNLRVSRMVMLGQRLAALAWTPLSWNEAAGMFVERFVTPSPSQSHNTSMVQAAPFISSSLAQQQSSSSLL